ncbi:MAG TPA: PLP-dependent aspartate aminotransferase family protein, partial [Polyangiaceae bacterium]|nr:PLP-dependent aspartate aminotransferase family protein [Polyangiaceae bacterium]
MTIAIDSRHVDSSGVDPRHVDSCIAPAGTAAAGIASAERAPAERACRDAAPGVDTLAVRGGEPARHGYAAVATPIVCTATYAFADSAEIADHFEGRVEREEYGRYGNPTVRAAEQKISALEGSDDTVLFPSGMSAITSLLLALLKPGDHVVMTSDCYRRTRQFLRTTMQKFGVEHSFVAPDDHGAIEQAVQRPRTRLLLTEAPTNPLLRVVDVQRLSEICARQRGVRLLVDSTLASPFNLRPLEHGAHLVLESCTKYLGGHNDLLAGSVSGDRDLMAALRESRGVFGAMPDPHGAYLLIRGIKTLAVRVRRHNESALSIARYLESHPKIERVFYPGLESHPDHAVARRLCSGFGGMVSFLVRGGLATTSRFIDGCTIPIIAPSMGGVETLIEQPALMSFYELTPEQRQAIGIAENLVRLSVGLEDPVDLIA